MAIQNRRGNYTDFDPQKLVPGEWAVVQSGDPNSERGKAVYMAFDVGDVERMATYEDMQENINSATTVIQEQFASELTQTISNANSAVTTMRNDIDNEIASASTTIENLTTQTNTVMDNSRLATAQANAAAEDAYDAAESVRSIIVSGTTVMSWNNRAGLVVPENGDYTSAQITHNDTTVEDALTFDSVPTANSERGVKSGGVFSILGNTTMGTTATTITGAIAEHEQDIINTNNALSAYKTTVDNLLTWKRFGSTDYLYGQTWAVVPTGAKEIFVAVYILWDNNNKVMVDFYFPNIPHMFSPSTTFTQHVNYWGTDYNGFVRLQTMNDANYRYVRLHDAYNGNTDITNAVYSTYWYR